MIGPLSTAILAGCLKALGGLLWAVAALVALLLAVQALRGGGGADPAALAALAGVFAGLGWVCRRAGSHIARR